MSADYTDREIALEAAANLELAELPTQAACIRACVKDSEILQEMAKAMRKIEEICQQPERRYLRDLARATLAKVES